MSFPAPVLIALRELSSLPYENLSKIVAFAEESSGGLRTGSKGRSSRERSMVLSANWLEKTRATGVGGTCFSLTWWLAARLKSQGIDCFFLMGDKGQAKNIHCALRWDWQGRAYLLDPGYMIFDPLVLPEAGLTTTSWVPPNEIRIEDLPTFSVWRLWTGPRLALKQRFDFRRTAVSEEEFLSHWEASFDLPMMGYPILNRVQAGTQYYLQKRSLLIRTPDGEAMGAGMRKLARSEMLAVLGTTFGIPEGLAQEALRIVTKRTPDFFER